MAITISGTNKLAERIISEAEADAQNTRAQAEASIAAIRAEGEKLVSQKRAEYAQKREAATQSLLDGCKTRASLDSRKTALAKKRVVIDKAFALTYEKLCALSGEARAKILESMLRAEAEGGETVLPSKTDRAYIVELLKGFSNAKLTLSEQDAPIDGGFLLVKKEYEKDCSFASLLAATRDAEETNVAKLLFD